MQTNSSFSEKVRSLDVFKSLPSDYLKSTFIGAICK